MKKFSNINNYSNGNGQRPQERLWDAASRGDSAMVRQLALNGDVDLNARNEEGFTAYNLATQGGHVNTALVILAAKNMAYTAMLGLSPSSGADMPYQSTGNRKLA